MPSFRRFITLLNWLIFIHYTRILIKLPAKWRTTSIQYFHAATLSTKICAAKFPKQIREHSPWSSSLAKVPNVPSVPKVLDKVQSGSKVPFWSGFVFEMSCASETSERVRSENSVGIVYHPTWLKECQRLPQIPKNRVSTSYYYVFARTSYRIP